MSDKKLFSLKERWEEFAEEMQERGDAFHQMTAANQRAIRQLVETVSDVLDFYRDCMDARAGDVSKMLEAVRRAQEAIGDSEDVYDDLADAVERLATAAEEAAWQFQEMFDLYGSDLRAMAEALGAVRHLIDFTPSSYQREQMATHGVTPPTWNS